MGHFWDTLDLFQLLFAVILHSQLVVPSSFIKPLESSLVSQSFKQNIRVPHLRNHLLKMSGSHFLYNETFPVLVMPVPYNFDKYQTVYKKVKFIQTQHFLIN